MKNVIISIFLFIYLFSFSPKVFAEEKCSPNGYTIFTINGIFTSEKKAKESRDDLKNRLLIKTFNNQPLSVDYLYNPTHLAGLTDIFDAIDQKYFENKDSNDYDMKEILNDASQKLKTQKVFLVGHSQGNFYANSMYNILTGNSNGVPFRSMGVYGIASPAVYVAGNGKYITSSSDSVINKVRMYGLLNILEANVNIKLPLNTNSNGHGFSDVYMKYEGSRIVKEIKESLEKLKENNIQNPHSPCISPPELDFSHKLTATFYTVADPTAQKVKVALVKSYEAGSYIANGAHNAGLAIGNIFKNLLFATALESLPEQEVQASDLPEQILPTIEPPVEVLPPPQTVEPEIVSTEPLVSENETPKIETPIVQPQPTVFHGGGGRRTTESVTEENSEENDGLVVEEEEEPIVEEEPVAEEAEEEPAVEENNEEEEPVQEEPAPEPDITPPVITLLGDSPKSIVKDSVYGEPGATALDGIDGSVEVIITGTVNTASAGIYSLTYTATDLSGNIATAIRKVVVDDGAKLNRPNDVFISGNYAYVVSESSNSLEIIDISNPETLVHKGSIVHGNNISLFAPKDIVVSGNYAYVVSYSNSLEIIDVSNPILPFSKGTLNNGVNGAQLASPISIAVQGNYAYIASYGSQAIEIVNISDPTNPVHQGSHSAGLLAKPLSVFVRDNYLYVTFSVLGTDSGFFQIIDVSNPSLPVLKSSVQHGTNGASVSNPESVFVSGDYAYITSRGDRTLEIINVANPLSPFHQGKVSEGFGNQINFVPNDIFVSSNYAYVTSFVGNTLEIVDVSDSSNPIPKGSIAHNINGSNISAPTSVYLSGNYAYVSSNMGNALEVVDISNPESPIHKNKILHGEFNHTDPPPAPPPAPDTTPPAITSYTFNGTAQDIVFNPTSASLALSFTSSENVNWMSIKIENENDASIYKIFQSGANCVDGTNTCAKTWDGILSGGSSAPAGIYKIKMHIKDDADNEFYDYLTPYKITVNIN